MNVDRPHEIRDGAEIKKKPMAVRAHHIRLTPEEHARLEFASEQERAEFVRSLPTKERLARWLESEEAPSWMVYKARRGVYDDFDDNGADLPQIEFVKDAKSCGRYDLSKPIIEGEFDAPKHESDAWAAKQTGQMKRLLDALDRSARKEGGDARP